MDIHVIGATHRQAPIEVRERLAFSDEELVPALRDLCGSIAEEAAIVSTCNRTEVYVVSHQASFSVEAVKDWLRRWKRSDVASGQLFSMHGGAAVQHLIEVASGMDSQVIGDIQIIGQVREAYHVARDNGTLGKLLLRAFETALHTGKRVKNETDLFSGAVSISYVAVELAKKIFHPLATKRALVVGAGETGELTARNLHGQGVNDITITNRSSERARDLVERLGFGVPIPLQQLADRLHEFDIVIVSTGAREYLISYDMARAAGSRRSLPQLIVDISVPRNVDPRISSLSSVFCKDLNDLNSVIESNVEKRRAELPRAELIIAEELAKFSAWSQLLPVTPVVAQLRRRSDEIMRAELEKNRHRFLESDFENIEKLVGSVVRKIIGMPMAHLLDVQNDLQHTLVKAEYVKVLFNLNEIESAHRADGDDVGAADQEPTPQGGSSSHGAEAAPRNGTTESERSRSNHA